MLKDVEVTHQRTPLAAVVLVKARKMKEAWCLATNRSDMTARQVVATYGRRFTIEETFRDTKDIRFGFGMSSSRISNPSAATACSSCRRSRSCRSRCCKGGGGCC